MQLNFFEKPNENTHKKEKFSLTSFKKGNLVISFSGGKSSALMLIKLWEAHKDNNNANILVCFANTGDEDEETLLFIKRVQDQYKIPVVWLEAYISPIKGLGVMPVVVDFKTASRDKTPMFDLSEKLGHPNISVKHCTRDLKTRTINKYAQAYFNGGDYWTTIGYRLDEAVEGLEVLKKNGIR